MGIQILKIAHRKVPISQGELPHKAQRAQNKDPYAGSPQTASGHSWGWVRAGAAPTACNLEAMTNDHQPTHFMRKQVWRNEGVTASELPKLTVGNPQHRLMLSELIS